MTSKDLSKSAIDRLSKTLSDLEGDVHKDGNLLIRIDERTKSLLEDMKVLKGSFVRKEEFEPVKRLVYGMVGTILLAVVGGLLALVIK